MTGTGTITVDKQQLTDLFRQTFVRTDKSDDSSWEADLRFFFAPGRVNLIGDHTDYTGGYVFPAALTFGTWAVVRPRKDSYYRFASTDYDGIIGCHTSNVVYDKEDGWANYSKGVLSELMAYVGEQSQEVFTGADVLYHGNIPSGAGLSSSASIEMVTAVALTNLAAFSIPMMELVKLAQRAENDFVGMNCGIMDQFAVGMGKKDHAVMLNCGTLHYEYVPFNIGDYRLVITNTNKQRGLTDSNYNERRRECDEGFEQVQRQLPHIKMLGELHAAEWRRIRDHIPAGLIRNRLEHVVRENERVVLAVECLRRNDLASFGQSMMQSHESLRDLYDVTGVELDTLFDVARHVDGCIGTRMTGGGFGGCTVSLVKADKIEQFKSTVSAAYTEHTGLTADFYICDIGDGAKELTLA